MNTKNYCVIGADNLYHTIVYAIVEGGTETVKGYRISDGERLLDVHPPIPKLYANDTGFVKPRWDEDANAWVEGANEAEISDWNKKHTEPEIDIGLLRASKQEKNKKALSDWLSSHPLTWIDGNVYGVTEQDQNEMAFILTKYNFFENDGKPILLEWHAQKKERHEFTLEEYKKLFFAIDEYVEPYRRYQESIKQAIYEAETVEEINAIQIDYSMVSLNA